MNRVSKLRIAELLSFVIVAIGLPFEPDLAGAQFPPVPFPVLQVDSAVRARLAEEWEPNNRYQHERGYCVRFTTEQFPASWFHPPTVVYTLTDIIRGDEIHTTQNGLGGIGCPNASDITLLHVHPPFYCSEDDKGSACSNWDPMSHQCYPSDTDARTLLNSKRPFDLVQCGPLEIIPYYRLLYAMVFRAHG
jgi:hypothetical protein